MILILKRDDLPSKNRQHPIESIKLDHSGLPSELIEKAELIAFVEGVDIKFLKEQLDIHSKETINVLMRYITSTEPANRELPRFSVKRSRHWKKK